MNKDNLSGLDVKWSFITKILARLGHWRRKNTLTGSKKNIQEHYDLSNEFYKLWLDSTMTYSAAFFKEKSASLEDASIEKLDRLCRKLDLKELLGIVAEGSNLTQIQAENAFDIILITCAVIIPASLFTRVLDCSIGKEFFLECACATCSNASFFII